MSPFLHPHGFRAKFLSVAVSQIGVRESGSNSGAVIRKYQSSTWLKPGAWPWCAAFVCWVYLTTWISFWRSVSFGSVPFPTTPRALEFRAWGLAHGSILSADSLSVVSGDLVVFRFRSGHHVGIVESVSDGVVRSVDGNTNQSNGRDGDGVYRACRSLTSVVCFVHLHES